MNTYKKYCPNVFVAQCEEKHEKGDIVTITTKYGKENEHIIHNFVGHTGTRENPMYCYSITRLDGFNNQERAKNKVEKLNGYADNAEERSEVWREKSNEGKDFLSLGEPIKVGHHSEKRHRALIERNWNRFSNAMEELGKAKSYRERTAYWESMANKIDLSMPESLEFFAVQLEEAKEYHQGLKDGSIKREHSFSLTYAKKRVNDLTEKVKTANTLWADSITIPFEYTIEDDSICITGFASIDEKEENQIRNWCKENGFNDPEFNYDIDRLGQGVYSCYIDLPFA